MIDLVIGIIGFPFFLIAYFIFAPIIFLTDKGPVFYIANRVGKNGKLFKMYKFRTMKEKRTENMSHDDMVTSVGKFIRKTSLDELPQLFNVIKGDMSLIGPRPWILQYYEWMTPIQKRRVSVRPRHYWTCTS